MTKEIKSTLIKATEPLDFYGFGSFFRGALRYNDVDLLVVCDASRARLKGIYDNLRELFAPFGETYHVPVHIFLVTRQEFFHQPLANMDEIVFLGASPQCMVN